MKGLMSVAVIATACVLSACAPRGPNVVSAYHALESCAGERLQGLTRAEAKRLARQLRRGDVFCNPGRQGAPNGPVEVNVPSP